jgi:phosphatidylglycerophosphatase A
MKWFVTVGGVGLLPKAPGTFGSLVALPFAWVFGVLLSPLLYMGLCVLLTILAIIVCDLYEKSKGSHDGSEIVIDEFVGMLITLTWLPLTWQSLLAGFILFRILDIAKPLFIGLADRKIRGGAGVVADDVLAGIVANVILQVIYQQTQWLGYQLVSR